MTEYVSKKEARKMDNFIHYGVAAGIQAIKDSGLRLRKRMQTASVC
jgi:3-oxoacyl-[acyl-carrier-protein] synthase II